MSEVIVMKMVNGDEVIANMVNEGESYLIVDRPRVIRVEGDSGSMMPYFISDPDRKDIAFDKIAIVANFPASKDLSDAYTKATSSILLG